MTTRDYENRVTDLGMTWYGHHKVSITYRGKSYKFTTTNTLATDRLRMRDEVNDGVTRCFYTYKGALKALYEEGRVKCITTKL